MKQSAPFFTETFRYRILLRGYFRVKVGVSSKVLMKVSLVNFRGELAKET